MEGLAAMLRQGDDYTSVSVYIVRKASPELVVISVRPELGGVRLVKRETVLSAERGGPGFCFNGEFSDVLTGLPNKEAIEQGEEGSYQRRVCNNGALVIFRSILELSANVHAKG